MSDEAFKKMKFCDVKIATPFNHFHSVQLIKVDRLAGTSKEGV